LRGCAERHIFPECPGFSDLQGHGHLKTGQRIQVRSLRSHG